jgi:hypothetical protein
LLNEIKIEIRKQQRGVQGCNANPSRYLKENQIEWLISQTEKVERLEKQIGTQAYNIRLLTESLENK